MKRRKGHEIDYAGKKYVSLHELCDDLDLPYKMRKKMGVYMNILTE